MLPTVTEPSGDERHYPCSSGQGRHRDDVSTEELSQDIKRYRAFIRLAPVLLGRPVDIPLSGSFREGRRNQSGALYLFVPH